MRIYYFSFCLLIGMLFFQCTDPVSPDLPVNSHLPLDVANTWTYEVQLREYTPTSQTTTRYSLKDSIISVTESPNGLVADFIRFKCDETNPDWIVADRFSVRDFEQQLIVTIDNIPVVKWAYPASEGKSFDSNAFNADPEQLFQMVDVDNSYETSRGIVYDDTTRVLQWDNDDFIVELEQRFELFAEGVGLVETLEKNYVYCQDAGCIGQQIVEEGFDLIVTLTDYQIQ